MSVAHQTDPSIDLAEMVNCPRSEYLAQTIGFTIHRVSRGELAQNQGLCARCFDDIRRGRHQSDIPEHHEARRRLTLEEDHIGRADGDGHLEPAADFVWHELGDLHDGLQEYPVATVKQAGLVLTKIIAWANPGSPDALAFSRKLLVAAFLITPTMGNVKNLVVLAEKLGVSKALTSKHATDFAKRFGRIQFRGQRNSEQRLRMKAAMLKSHARRSTPIPRNP